MKKDQDEVIRNQELTAQAINNDELRRNIIEKYHNILIEEEKAEKDN